MNSTPPIPCRYPECRHTAAVRELCWGHYLKAAFLVRKGYTTWHQLAVNGKCIEDAPTGDPGTKPKAQKFDYSWFMLDGKPLPTEKGKKGFVDHANA